MAKPEIFREPLSKDTIERLAAEGFGDMIKFVVDLDRRILCAGGGLHSDAEAVLLADGSQQKYLWGANYYPGRETGSGIEYTSMINIRPQDGNTKIEITSPDIRSRVLDIAIHFFRKNP